MTMLLRVAAFIVLAGCATAGTSSAGPIETTTTPARAAAIVGARAPELSLQSLDGAPVGVVPGKVNVVFFWATWSGPDKTAMPKLQEVYARRAEAGLAVLGISVDDEVTGVAEAARQWGARFPIAWDRDRRVAQLYEPSCEPMYFVIDRTGIVRFTHCGYRDGDADRIDEEVASLL